MHPENGMIWAVYVTYVKCAAQWENLEEFEINLIEETTVNSANKVLV